MESPTTQTNRPLPLPIDTRHPTPVTRHPSPDTRPYPETEPELVLIKRSSIHGTGAFARRDIPKGTPVIEYIGEKISKQESLRRCEADNQYIFTLNDEEDLDGSVAWNPARFINHSCAPNCDADVENDHVWIVAARDLKKDEELTYNYGFDLDEYKDYPCRCGAPDCVGYIVADEFFEHVRKQQEVARDAWAEPFLPAGSLKTENP